MWRILGNYFHVENLDKVKLQVEIYKQCTGALPIFVVCHRQSHFELNAMIQSIKDS